MVINNLIIEVTRRCNMKCEHCLRGKAQDVDFNPEYFRKFVIINDITFIGQLTLTGGEPSLVPDIISDITKIIKEESIFINNFYMVTNARHISNDFINAIIDLHLSTQEMDNNEVSISNDQYHYAQSDIDKISVLKFAKQREFINYVPIREGRARQLCDTRENDIFNDLCIEDNTVMGELYLNALGDITFDCNMSYWHQKKNKIGNYKSKLTDIIKIENPIEIAA